MDTVFVYIPQSSTRLIKNDFTGGQWGGQIDLNLESFKPQLICSVDVGWSRGKIML